MALAGRSHLSGRQDTRVLLEVDGVGGSQPFYSKTIDGLLANTPLTFSAYVVNVHYAGQLDYFGSRYVYPRLKFVLKDPTTGNTLAEKSTGDIQPDWRYGTAESWKYARDNELSAEWQLIGMNFVVPSGVESIQMYIYNDVLQNGNGNDFAIDDIEIHLCLPVPVITSSHETCEDSVYDFTVDFENDGRLVEPLEYQWYYSSDCVTWSALSQANTLALHYDKMPADGSGWYKIAIASEGNIEYVNSRTESEPFHLNVHRCLPPPLECPDGVRLFHEDLTGDETSWETTIDDLCGKTDLTLIVNLQPNHASTRLLFRLIDAATGTELNAYETGDIPSDSLQIGTTYTLPEGVTGLRWVISNNEGNGNAAPLAIANTEVRLCMEPIAVNGINPVCRKKQHRLQAIYENNGKLASPEFQWVFSPDSVNWSVLQTGPSKTYTIPVVHRSHEGWYKVIVADAGNIEQGNCRMESEPFKLMTEYCNTAVDKYIDTIVCDTLLHYDLHWRGHSWTETGTADDTFIDFEDDDSVYVHLKLSTQTCCPEIRTLRVDTAVCDTLMPFLWFYQDTMLLFTETGSKEIEFPHWRWTNCIGEVHTLALDTFHCERLYLLIHNKYNWQLVCNNTELARLFPDLHPLEFQWFKNSVAVEGATEDDYSEENELHGVFQLRIRLNRAADDDDDFIWSNVLEILDTPVPAPITKRVYNSSGVLVNEERLTRGIYVVRYQQGERVWTEKKVVL